MIFLTMLSKQEHFYLKNMGAASYIPHQVNISIMYTPLNPTMVKKRYTLQQRKKRKKYFPWKEYLD